MHELSIWEEVARGPGDPSAIDKSDLMEKAADALYPAMLHSFEELTIKKYGRVPEPILQEVFRKVEERTRDEERPVVYIEIGPATMALHRQKDGTDFYKSLVGRVLDAVERTRYGKGEGVKRLREQYETDFGRIYTKDEFGSLLKSFNNVGANLRYLVGAMVSNGWNRPIPLINIAVLPNFPKDSVTVQKRVETGLMKPDAKEFEKAASYASSVMQSFFLGGKGLKKTLAVPGWTIDILTHSWNNQEWNRSSWAEGGILEELGYRQILEL